MMMLHLNLRVKHLHPVGLSTNIYTLKFTREGNYPIAGTALPIDENKPEDDSEVKIDTSEVTRAIAIR